MPKVTLLADEWESYSMAFGKRMFEFHGGQPVDVPVAVALEAKKRVTREKQPLFRVEELPEIIAPQSDTSQVEQNVVRQDGKARHLVQSPLFPVGGAANGA